MFISNKKTMSQKKYKKTEEKPLTLAGLVVYNKKILLPALDQRFERIEDRLDGHDEKFESIEKRFDGLEQRFDGMEKRFDSMERRQEDMMLSFDHIFKKLDILIEDKEVRVYQHKKEKRLSQIIVESLKKKKILTKKQREEIDGLEVV